MSALRASYITVKRDGIIRYYRGVLRIGHLIVWQCQHEHRFGHSAARQCAEVYFESIGQHEVAEQVSQEGEGRCCAG